MSESEGHVEERQTESDEPLGNAPAGLTEEGVDAAGAATVEPVDEADPADWAGQPASPEVEPAFAVDPAEGVAAAVSAEPAEAPSADAGAGTPIVDAPEAEVEADAPPAADEDLVAADEDVVAAEADAPPADEDLVAAEIDAPAADEDVVAADETAEAGEPIAEAGERVASDEAAETEPAHAEPTTVAELIAATLRAAGVRLAFTVPGESFLPVLDAFAAAGIRVIATHHEGAAAMAAEAYGQLTGRPAACLGTRAVGAANLAIGIHTATADSTPMFALVGDVDRGIRGREAFQEVDLVGTIGRLAKWAGRIDDAETAGATLEAAVKAALEGRPGPALLVLPEDALDLALPEGTKAPVVRPHPEAPARSDVTAVLHALAGADRPLILAGAGVLRARCSNDLVRLAEMLHVPVVSSWRRGDVIPNDHPLYLGMTGFGSPATVRERVAEADVLVVIGSRLSEPTTAGYRLPAPGQHWIHIDAEPRTEAVGDSPAPALSIRADARAFLRAATARLKDAVLLAEPVAARDRNNAADRAAYEAASVVDQHPWSGPGVNPGKVVAELRRLLPEDAIVTTDAGAFAGWAARGFRFRRPGTFLGPTSGAMGYAFPAALAAAVVHRERRVVALVGDGGMGMTLAEIETAVREGAHVVAVVFDNERYGMIRDHQEQRGSPTSPGTDLGPVDFAAAARACGARGVRVETDAAFEPALRTALAASGPTLIHLLVDQRWVSVDQPATLDEA